MIDHLSVQARDLPTSAAFYDAILAPLGGSRLLEFPNVIGYGRERPEFWLGPTETPGEARELHLAFTADDRAAVEAFHDAAIKAGAEVLHEPRVWPEYHPTYFALGAPPYLYAGPMTYQEHSGDRPMRIIWRLQHRLPADMYAAARAIAA